MTKTGATIGLELTRVADAENIPRKSRMRRMGGRLGRCAAGISTCALGITVAAMAVAQQQNSYETPKKEQFQAPPDADPDAAADMILGVPVNTIFFVAAGLIALFWFTLGGGRKPKVGRN